ncbi:MAG: sulfite exporter TauE/SafE family protein [Acetobacteraceae bacterium]|nr:sulfite exporter TauE/SafE family protein [Acetobacteraceae bacterium]
MEPPLLPLLLGAAFGGLVQGLSGFAFGLVALTVWSWVMEPQVAGPLVVFCSFLGQLLALPALRQKRAGMGRALPFLLGGALGVPLGVAALRVIDPAGFKLALGLLLVLWCPAMLLMRHPPRIGAGGRLADALAGLGGGIMGGLGGLSGPLPILWCTLRGWPRDEQRGVSQLFNLAMHGLTMAAYLATGTVHAGFLPLFAMVAPAMLLPALLGGWLYRRSSDALFRRMVLALLTASGLVLLGSSLPRLP